MHILKITSQKQFVYGINLFKASFMYLSKTKCFRDLVETFLIKLTLKSK